MEAQEKAVSYLSKQVKGYADIQRGVKQEQKKASESKLADTKEEEKKAPPKRSTEGTKKSSTPIEKPQVPRIATEAMKNPKRTDPKSDRKKE